MKHVFLVVRHCENGDVVAAGQLTDFPKYLLCRLDYKTALLLREACSCFRNTWLILYCFVLGAQDVLLDVGGGRGDVKNGQSAVRVSADLRSIPQF